MVAHGDGSSSASGIGSLAGASEQQFQVERYEETLANPPKTVTIRPRITYLRLSASVEDDDASELPAVAVGPNSQLPALDGCAALTLWFEQ